MLMTSSHVPRPPPAPHVKHFIWLKKMHVGGKNKCLFLKCSGNSEKVIFASCAGCFKIIFVNRALWNLNRSISNVCRYMCMLRKNVTIRN